MDKIAVLIPCYNEAQTIAKVVGDFKRELPEATIYVYDNNSKDGTDEIARKAGAIVRYDVQVGEYQLIVDTTYSTGANIYEEGKKVKLTIEFERVLLICRNHSEI